MSEMKISSHDEGSNKTETIDIKPREEDWVMKTLVSKILSRDSVALNVEVHENNKCLSETVSLTQVLYLPLLLRILFQEKKNEETLVFARLVLITILGFRLLEHIYFRGCRRELQIKSDWSSERKSFIQKRRQEKEVEYTILKSFSIQQFSQWNSERFEKCVFVYDFKEHGCKSRSILEERNDKLQFFRWYSFKVWFMIKNDLFQESPTSQWH
jgi:hypothetical protein